MEAKHTPGPWQVDGPTGFGRWNVTSPRDAHGQFTIIADTHDRDNAALMAAAPDLAAACEVLLDYHGIDAAAFLAKYGRTKSQDSLLGPARAALQKAGLRP